MKSPKIHNIFHCVIPFVIIFLFHHEPLMSQIQTKLLASDGSQHDEYGTSVAIDGDRVVIGAFGYNVNNFGAIYIYDWDGMNWNETIITASDGIAHDKFGYAVAIDGDRVIVGAEGDDDNMEPNSGSVYVYEWNGTSWIESKLTASDADAGDRFGYAVAIEGDRIIVGAISDDDNGNISGSAYIYEWDGISWGETKLTASNGLASDEYGYSVGIDGDRAIIGAYLSDANGSQSGAAYIYNWDGTSWIETIMAASNASSSDHYGCAVDIDGDLAIIGAELYQENGKTSGCAYIYEWDGMSWNETSLVPSDGETSDHFGKSVSIFENRVIVGANEDDVGALIRSGSAYVFNWDGASWIESKITPSDGASQDEFGISVSIDGDRAIIGANKDDDNGTNSGSSYIFELGPPPIEVNCNWLGFVYNPITGIREPNEIPCSFIAGDTVHIPPSATTLSTYWTGFINPNDFNTNGDNVSLEARVKNPSGEGGLDCFDIELWLIGEDNFAAVGLMNTESNCEQYAFMGTDDNYHSGTTHDLSVLQTDLASFQIIKIEAKNNNINVYKNDILLRTMTYNQLIGNLQGIKIAFKGSGTFDWVKLKNATTSSIIYEEEFNDCNTICPDCNDVLIMNQYLLSTGGYESNDKILSTGTIGANSNISFQSENSIELNPGFDIKSGALFEAIIGTCSF